MGLGGARSQETLPFPNQKLSFLPTLSNGDPDMCPEVLSGGMPIGHNKHTWKTVLLSHHSSSGESLAFLP